MKKEVGLRTYFEWISRFFHKIPPVFWSLLSIFVVSRLVILAISLIGYHNFQLELEPQKPWSTHIEGLWSQFDVLWYKDVSLHGYEQAPFSPAEKKNWAFLPLYPVSVGYLLKAFDEPSFFWVGSIFSSLLALAALYLLADLFKDRLESQQRFFLFYLISSGSFYLSIPYTESLSLFLLACTFYFTKQKRYALAAIMAGLGAIARIQLLGLLLIPLVPLLQEKTVEKKGLKILTVLALFAAPTLGHMSYLYALTANPWAFVGMQESWGNTNPYPLEALLVFIQNSLHNNPCQWLHLFVWSIFIACFVRNYKKIPLNEALFCLVVFLISTSCEKFWGAYRYVLMLAPIYLAMSNEKSWFQQLYVYSSLIVATIYILTFTNNNGFAI